MPNPNKVRRAWFRMGYPIEEFEPSMTQQQFVPECDINNILKRHADIGVLPQVAGQPMFGDFSDLPTYHEALNMVVEAREAFDTLPSDVRTFFDNDPGKFVDFMSDDSNYDKAVELGLVEPKVASQPESASQAATPPNTTSSPGEGAGAPS